MKHCYDLGEQYEMGDGVEFYRPRCSCGWRGVPIDTHIAANECSPISGARGGGFAEALVQVLDHIHYDPIQDENVQRAKIQNALDSFFAPAVEMMDYDSLDRSHRELRRVVEEISEARLRQKIWKTERTKND